MWSGRQGKARLGGRGGSRPGRRGSARDVWVRQGWAWCGSSCQVRVWHGRAWPGGQGMARRGLSRLGMVWRGEARQARQVLAGHVKAQRGLVWPGRHGKLRRGTARRGVSRQAWLGNACRGPVRRGSQGMARLSRGRPSGRPFSFVVTINRSLGRSAAPEASWPTAAALQRWGVTVCRVAVAISTV